GAAGDPRPMSARRAATLHVTNGDSVLYVFKKAGIVGTHLAWRDELNEGPVPAALTLEATSAVRAHYLAGRGYGKPIKIIHDFQSRDAQLLKAGDFQEVVLWFEHDLYDQLQLLQVLVALDDLQLEPGRVSLVQSDRYLGAMTADELSPLLPRRRTATAATFKSARRAWQRFTSPSPADLFAAAQEDAIGLPFLRLALQRLCEEYPLRQDGLSRSQRQALAAVAQGPADGAELYVRAQAREEAGFQGDAAFARMLDDLRDERAPLVTGAAGTLELTALGRRVLGGEADWLATYPIDRWVGGVHLTPERTVRWDEDAARFVET
ncbi:MAG: hypothetical protein WB615_07530, partial [Candidatus Tumulicola sp.]